MIADVDLKNKKDNNSSYDFDVVIIGAGMGGLTAGNILLKKGYSVLIVEKQATPGGCCTNFKRKDYTFDACIHMINGCRPKGMIYEILKQFNAEDCVEFIELDEIFHWVDLLNKIDFSMPTSLEKLVNGLTELFPHESKNIQKFYKNALKITKFMVNWIKNRFLGKIIVSIRYFRSLFRFLRLLNKTVSDLIDPYISDTALKNIMTSMVNYFGLPPGEESALIFIVGSMSFYLEGTFYVKGGSGTFSQAITDIFIKNGGKLLLSTEVTKLIFEEKIIKELITEDKKGIEMSYSTRSVIANCDLTMLVTKQCPSGTIPYRYIEKIKSRQPSKSAVIIYAGINLDLKKYNHTDYELWTTWGKEKYHTKEHRNYIYESADYSNLPGGPITIFSNIDPTCCPPGKSVLSSLFFANAEPFEKTLGSEQGGEKYKALKVSITDQFINQISQVLKIPDLRSHIEVLELATPITLKRYTNNRDGALFGWEMTPKNMLRNQLSQKTPVKNLFLCGHWAKNCGGVSVVMMSGSNVSEIVQKYLK